VVIILLKELDSQEVSYITKEFFTFPQDLTKLAQWLLSEQVELSVMESTVVY
jgi:hypothetical protein